MCQDCSKCREPSYGHGLWNQWVSVPGGDGAPTTLRREKGQSPGRQAQALVRMGGSGSPLVRGHLGRNPSDVRTSSEISVVRAFWVL